MVLFLPLRWLFQARPISLNPERDCLRFVDDIKDKYGQTHVNFHQGSYLSAVKKCFEEFKFLLVYIHSPLHDDTNLFCREILSSPAFVSFANDNLVCWGGQVFDPEAYALSLQLGVTSYPFMALMLCQSNNSVQVIDRIQGFFDVNLILDQLRNSLTAHSTILYQQREESNRRSEAVRLREQQDREYRESIEAEMREIQRKEEEERKKIEEEEARKQQEELEAAIELSKKLSRESTIKRLKDAFALNPEPENGSDIATVRFQLPRGKKLSRRFLKNDTTQKILDYLKVHFFDEGDVTQNFSVSTHFPKIELTDMSQTVDSLGLFPRGMLYVQDLDT